MGTDAESAIRCATPVFQVVGALKPRQSPVGNFVMNITALRELLGGLIVESDVYVVILKFRIAPAPNAPFFSIEHVNGNVLRAKALEAAEILFPYFMTLVRQTGNQIHTDVVEAATPKRVEIF